MSLDRKRRLFILLFLTIICIGAISFFRNIPQPESYHAFADTRPLWGIPNFANVISNLPFLVTGLLGLAFVGNSGANHRLRLIYGLLFSGVLLIAIGSCYYHLHPDNARLVFDRIPMTIVFMSLLAATVAEFIDEKAGFMSLCPLVIFGIGSVLYWYLTEKNGHGDLRPYVLVQFYPVVFIPLIMVFFPSPAGKKAVVPLAWVVGWYVVAKILEIFDKEIYNVLGVVSGHTLKHLAACLSTYYFVVLYKRKR